MDFCRRAVYAMRSRGNGIMYWNHSRSHGACLRGPATVIAILIVSVFFNFAAASEHSCKAPATARERLICGDPKLVRADRALALDYRTALGAVSKPGRDALRDGQREWLSYTASICAVGRDAPHARPSALCLEDEYVKRQRQLKNAVVKSGGMVIRRVDLFKVTHASMNNPNVKFNMTVVSFPQIDKPRDEWERAWNKLIAEHSRSDEAKTAGSPDNTEDHDLYVDYALGLVSPTMISLSLLFNDDWHGAHGIGAEESLSWLIHEGRPLRADDLFDMHRAWDAALAALVLERAKREADAGGYELPFSDPAEIVADVSDPAHWLVGEGELAIRFDSGGSGCCSVVEAKIPWEQIKSYLRSPLPFPIVTN